MPKVIVTILLISVAITCYANYHEPSLLLSGLPRIENNTIDYYKLPKGVIDDTKYGYLLGTIKTTIETKVDQDNKLVELIIKVNNYQVYPSIFLTFDEYVNGTIEGSFQANLLKMAKETLRQTDRTESQGIIPEIVINLPTMAIPKGVRSILGNKAGRLSLDGSQKISISGNSSSRKGNIANSLVGNKSFDLTMKQESNINLNGTIGEKINVALKYSSNQETSLFDPNNIKLSYTGTDDEVVNSVEVGNTSMSISGSKYVSASGSSQGLFGIKTKLKLGDLDLTTVISKEESQKSTQEYKGNAQADSVIFRPNRYQSLKFYFYKNPYKIYSYYDYDDCIQKGLPTSWAHNAILTDRTGAWIVPAENNQFLPKGGTFHLFVDDNIATNNVTAQEASLVDEEGTPINPSEKYHMDELTENTDYVVDVETGLITLLNKTINKQYTLGIVYTQNNGITVGQLQPTLKVRPIQIINQDDVVDTLGTSGTPEVPSCWHFQTYNIYSLDMQNVKSDGFYMTVYTETSTKERITTLSDSLLAYNHLSSTMYFIDYLGLDSNKDGKVDGNDATVNLTEGYVIFPLLRPFEGIGDSLVYKDRTVQIEDLKNYILVKGKIGREQISLGSSTLLPGSVKVHVNDRLLTENVDYIVDYDMGYVTFLTPEGKNSDASIKIEYESRSMFHFESKNLIGTRADWKPNDNFHLGGTFIYNSEKVNDKRPKIGNENRSIVMGDVDGLVNFEFPFFTTLVDWLPLIRTDEASTISLKGEVAFSVPRIYGTSGKHEKEAYIDDMEAVLESYPLGISPTTWVRASKPYSTNLVKARTNWYKKPKIYNEDVYDPSTLSEKERKEAISILSCKIIPPAIQNPSQSQRCWGGLMRYIGNQVDFSDKRYIEILAKVNKPNATSEIPNAILHIDLGNVSEDFYTEHGGLGVLNTEDGKSKDNNTPNGILDYDEDIGLDGIASGKTR